jgi:hypothetical protein
MMNPSTLPPFPRVKTVDIEQDGTLRTRVWSLEGAERSLTDSAMHSGFVMLPGVMHPVVTEDP